MSDKSKKQEELLARREARRKRRIRNQILAYSVVILFIIALAAGVVTLVNFLSGDTPFGNRNSSEVTEQSSQVAESSTEESESATSVAQESQETASESKEPDEPLVLTYEQKLDQIVNAAIEVMPIEDKVAGLFMVTPELLTGVKTVTKAGDSTKAALAKYAVGGVLYTSKNVKNKNSFMEMLSNTELFSKYPVFLAVEEEGGKTTQIANLNIGSKTDSAKDLAATGDTQRAYLAGITISTYLKELGINMDLAPVGDLANVENSFIADRSFGADAETVAGYVSSVIRGLQEQDILPCVKHFPGMGSVTTDPAKGVVVSERTEEEFWGNEFVLFQKLVDEKVPAIMISNMAAPALTGGDNVACTLSERIVTGILRNELGYNGLVVTGMLNDKAIADYHSADEVAILALKAGCDMLLCPEDFELAYNGVLQAVQDGTISQERVDDALRRIYRIKFADRVEQDQ